VIQHQFSPRHEICVTASDQPTPADRINREHLIMTDPAQITERLNEIFRDVLDDDEINLVAATTAEDVDGWDSLAHIRLMIATQSAFGVKFSAAEIGKLNNIGDLIALISKRQA